MEIDDAVGLEVGDDYNRINWLANVCTLESLSDSQ